VAPADEVFVTRDQAPIPRAEARPSTSGPPDVDRADTLRLLQRIVRHPSVGPGSETERALAELLEYLELAGLRGDLVRLSTDAPPLALVTLVGADPGPHVLLQGHIDVVPIDVGWTREPFAAEFEGGYVYGRGTADMKGGLTAFASALTTLSRSGLARGAVTLLVDSDEETGSDQGLIPYIAERGLGAFDWAICGEPTGLRPYLGNRGLVWARVEVRGVASHAGMPRAGRNPIPAVAHLIEALPTPPALEAPYGATGPSLTPTTLHAGAALNSIPGNAVLTIDRRLVPGEDVDEVSAQLEKAVLGAIGAGSGLDVRFEAVKSWPPCLLEEDSELAQVAQAVTRRHGYDSTFGFDDACNDASFLSEAGLPTIIWGPGDPQLAHTSDERVALEEVQDAASMYVDAVLTLTDGGVDE
jgi:acetylornithine deacetylase/succinyl-diaminopimelate desuccinylase-like protein